MFQGVDKETVTIYSNAYDDAREALENTVSYKMRVLSIRLRLLFWNVGDAWAGWAWDGFHDLIVQEEKLLAELRGRVRREAHEYACFVLEEHDEGSLE